MIKDQMNKIYKNTDPAKIPWNMETIPEILWDVVKSGEWQPGKIIEPGCGAGNYVIHFAKHGFDATGVDISEYAIELARKSAQKAQVKCKFIVADVLGDLLEITATYDFVYDWELLHHVFPEDRNAYIRNVTRLLKPGGRYLSVCFSEQSEQFGGNGKYRKTPLNTLLYFSSETEIRELLNPFFVIDDLKTVEVKGKFAPHKAIYALATRKSVL